MYRLIDPLLWSAAVRLLKFSRRRGPRARSAPSGEQSFSGQLVVCREHRIPRNSQVPCKTSRRRQPRAIGKSSTQNMFAYRNDDLLEKWPSTPLKNDTQISKFRCAPSHPVLPNLLAEWYPIQGKVVLVLTLRPAYTCANPTLGRNLHDRDNFHREHGSRR